MSIEAQILAIGCLLVALFALAGWYVVEPVGDVYESEPRIGGYAYVGRHRDEYPIVPRVIGRVGVMTSEQLAITSG